MLCGLEFRRVSGQEEKANSVWNLEVALAMPTGVVENENDDAVATGPGFFGESRQQSFEERLGEGILASS